MDRRRKQHYTRLISLYGHTSHILCPLCGSLLLIRYNSNPSKFGPSYKACPLYPVCKGMRFSNGDPIFNDYTIRYLSDKETINSNDRVGIEINTSNRFENL